MPKDIRTHEADINLVKKFLDYAECADASYASLKYALYLIFGIFVIALLNGCSFKYIDPQYYKYKNLVQSNSFVLYDKQLKAIGDLYYNTKIAVTLEMNKDGSIEKATFQEYLSRIYQKESKLKGYVCYNKEYPKENISSRIVHQRSDEICERDNNRYIYRIFHRYTFTEIGLFFGGDEGRGFYFRMTRDRANHGMYDIIDRFWNN
ncbi:hypothetical protein NHP164001_21280 [Helicobacter trogontum]|uniref:Lipoprotein n=1 Tax=Helicobacter trogontum TaxID=50960 RepID=A0ABQ0D6X8_9HELI